MDWGFILALGLGVLGAALLVGGIVGYLGSKKTGLRALSAGAAASGLVMLAVVAFSIPTSRTVSNGAPEPTIGFSSAPLTGPTPTPTTPIGTPMPTSTPTLDPFDLCAQYLGLSLSWNEKAEPAVATSYHCNGLWVDNAGRAPSSGPSLIVPQGEPLTLSFDVPAERRMDSLEIRVYPMPGVYGSFFHWPEGLPSGPQPVATHQPSPSITVQYHPPADPGEYSLVVRAAWEGQVDVFYGVSFGVE